MSGAGKSTLMDLLPRFHDVTSGRILLDGHDLRSVTQTSLRAQMGIVTQETFLFSDSVYYNIAYGRPEASSEEVVRAARQAHAHDFIAACPEGYDTLVGERGVRLSGGQRQRIAIARAFLKNPPILILDEATSDLDAESEFMVQQALAELMKGRTVLVIAHRLATVRNANRIVVVHEGRIAEVGRHDALLARDGVYRRLYALQMEGVPG
jgi:ATP-binding cassette, subfamily B, bacterial MsbA